MFGVEMLEEAYWKQLSIMPTYEFHETRRDWFHGVKPEHESFLYRALDTDDGLLYVGITDNFWNRLRDHQRGSSWWNAAKNILVYGCSNRMEAAAMEKLSIMIEAPIFNIQGNLHNSVEIINVEPIIINCLNCNEAIEAVKKKLLCPSCKNTLEGQGVRFCGFHECYEILDGIFERRGQKYCSRKCRNADWYLNNVGFHQTLYQIQKSLWEKSDIGKLAGVTIHEWIKLPISVKDPKET